jgi:hypothetical protein
MMIIQCYLEGHPGDLYYTPQHSAWHPVTIWQMNAALVLSTSAQVLHGLLGP